MLGNVIVGVAGGIFILLAVCTLVRPKDVDSAWLGLMAINNKIMPPPFRSPDALQKYEKRRYKWVLRVFTAFILIEIGYGWISVALNGG